MLEKYIASLLVPYFSKYVEDIDEKKLSVDIWNGRASLHDLVLRSSVLDTLLDPDLGSDGSGGSGSSGSPSPGRLPLHVHRGVCKNVTLDIPVKRLRSQPVVLEIDEVLLTLRANFVPDDVADDTPHASSSSSSSTASENHGSSSNAKTQRWDRVAASKARQLDQFEAERMRQHNNNNNNSNATAGTSEGAEQQRGGASSPVDSKENQKGGFISQLGELVINNMIIKVRSVHVRFEDAANRVVLGAILGDVQLVTVNEATGEASFVDPSKLQRMSKRLVFSGLQVYCDDPTHMRTNECLGACWYTAQHDWQRWYHLMKSRVKAGDVALSTVFGPVSGQVDAQVVFGKFVRQLLTVPYASVSLQLQHVMARLTRAQYTAIVRTASHFSNWKEVAEVVLNRPRVPVKGHAREWWRFAINTVRRVLGEPRQTRILERVSEICRIDYQVLYRDVVRKTDMSPEKKRAYRFITRFMTVPDMIEGRKHVYAQLTKEIVLKRKDHEYKKAEAAALESSQQQQQVPQRSWFGWLRGGSAAGPQVPKEVEEEERFLRSLEEDYGLEPNSIGSEAADSSRASTTDLPPSYTWMDLTVAIPFMGFRIDMENGEQASLSVYQLHSRLLTFHKSRSAQCHAIVHNITVSNPFVSSEGGQLVTNLVQGLPPHHHHHRHSSSTVLDVDAESGATRLPVPSLDDIVQPSSSGSRRSSQTSDGPHIFTSTPLLQISACVNPVEQPLEDTKLDIAVRVRLLPLRIVADPGTIRNMAHFFRFPRGVDLSAVSDSTRQAASAMGTAASLELRSAMATARGLFVSVDVSAPVVLLPKCLNASAEESTLAISLGRIRFHTQPLTETEKTRRLSSSAETEDMMYYSSRASFSRFFVSLTTLSEAVKNPESGMMLVPTVAVAADVLQRIDDRNEHREWLIVRLRVPKMRAACSLHQVYLLTSMMDTWATGWAPAAMKSPRDVAPLSKKLLGVSESPLGQDSAHSEVLTVRSPLALKKEDNTNAAAPTAAPAAASAKSGCGSPTTVAAAAEQGEDLPQVRFELLVEHLSFDVHEDDPITLKPITPARFSLAFVSVEYIMAVCTAQTKIVLIFTQPRIVDTLDAERPILSGSQVRVDVDIPRDGPVAIGVLAEDSVTARLGTPLIEVVEHIMDTTNLILCSLNSSSRHSDELYMDNGDFSPEESVHASALQRTASDLAYKMRIVKEQCAMTDSRVANVSIRLEGTSTVEFFNRRVGDEEDYLFACATATGVDILIKKNTVTMDVNGRITTLSARVADCHGLLPENSVVLQHTPHIHSRTSTQAIPSVSESPVMPVPSRAGESDSTEKGSPPLSGMASVTAPAPHVSFSFRKGKPVMPLFVEVDGKRFLSNAADLRYSSSVELELGASTMCVDMYTVMLLQMYFTTGFMSRLVDVSNRPLYNGKVLPPAREGPRLLMSMRVVARDVSLLLPCDPRTGTEAFRAAVGHLVVQNSLHASEGVQTTSVSLREIALWREEDRHGPPSGAPLIPSKTSMDVAIRSSIDLESDEPLHADIKSDDIVLHVQTEDFLCGCRLLRQNLSRVAVHAGMSDPRGTRRAGASMPMAGAFPIASPLSDVSAPAPSGGFAASIAQMNRDTAVTVRLARIAVRFFGDAPSSPAPSSPSSPSSVSPLFELCSSGVALRLIHPSNVASVSWKSLELLDTRSGKSSSLLVCEEGSARSATSLTTRTIVMNDFGVRPTALSSSAEGAEGSIAAGSDLTGATPLFVRGGGGAGAAALNTSQSLSTHSIELISLSVLTVDFTLRRFAVSTQWLSVYDFFCNESVSGIWHAPQAAVHTIPSSAAELCELSWCSEKEGAPVTDMTVTGGGFRCVITTPSVVVPFLTHDCEPIIEASITSLLIDVVGLPGGNELAVKVKELEVIDCVSGEKILSRQRADADDDFEHNAVEEDANVVLGHSPVLMGVDTQVPQFVGGSAPAQGISSTNVGAAAGVAASGESSPATVGKTDTKDVLGFYFKADPPARKNRMLMSVGRLDVLCSMPILYGIMDYALSPTQPLLVIANLGVMKEQRERVAKAAQDMADSTIISMHMLWHQPRIVIVGDVDDLSNRSRHIEARLGTMRANLTLDRQTKSTTMAVKMHDFCIPDLLTKSAMRFHFQSRNGKEDVAVTLEQASILFYPTEVERMCSVLHFNLLRPHLKNGYYGDLCSTPVSPEQTTPASPVDKVSAAEDAPPTERTIVVDAQRLLLEIHDLVGINTHSLKVSDFHLSVHPSSDVHVRVPAVSMVEHFTNKVILYSGRSAETNESPQHSPKHGSIHSKPHVSTAASGDAVTIKMSAAKRRTSVDVSQVNIILVPRGIGGLINTLLSVQVPSYMGAAAAAPAPSGLQDTREHKKTTVDKHGKESATATGEDSHHETVRSLRANLQECSVRVVCGDSDIAVLRLSEVGCVTEAFKDGSNKMKVQMGRLVMEDVCSTQTLYRDIICPYEDKDDTQSANNDSASAIEMKKENLFVNLSLWTAPPLRQRTGDTTNTSTYIKRRLSCEVGSLSFTVIPDVARALMRGLSDVKYHVAEANRGKAMNYLADSTKRKRNVSALTATDDHSASKHASLPAAEEDGATEVNIRIHRPRVLIVDAAMSVRSIELHPGSTTIRSEISMTPTIADATAAGAAAEEEEQGAKQQSPQRPHEIIKVVVERMGMQLLGEDAFKESCRVDVLYQRALQIPGLPPAAEVLSVAIPQLAVRLSPKQTDFVMDVLGAFMHGSLREGGTHQVGAVASSVSGRSLSQTVGGLDSTTGQRRLQLDASLRSQTKHQSSPPPLASSGSILLPPADPDVEDEAAQSTFVIRLSLSSIETDIAELFRLKMKDAQMVSSTSATTGSTTSLFVSELMLQHVGAHVSGGAAAAHGARVTRIDEVVDVLAIDKLVVTAKNPTPVTEVEHRIRSEEHSVDVGVGLVKVAISPTILFDTRELLYLPFSSKVLRIPIEPVAVLKLHDELTKLDGDVTLDAKHVLITANPKRCCYHLDLNNHRLILTGSPSAQIVLNTGCELTISNGTVSIPGMFAIGSFVSFAPTTSLFTTPDCVVEKQFHDMDNGALAAAGASAGRPPNSPLASETNHAANHNRGSSARPDSIGAAAVLFERQSRFMGNFSCDDVIIQVLCEEVVDLSTSVHMRARASFMQDTEHQIPVRRSVSLQLLDVHSGEGEERTLLPTSLTGNFSGVDNVSVSLLLGPIEFCSRASIARVLLEIAKDFGTAFIEETTMKRYTPTMTLETTAQEPLVVVANAGECEHCGSNSAYLAKGTHKVGSLCLHCCTGRDSLPATDFRLEVPALDGILIGAGGDLVHMYMRRLLVSVDTNMDAQAHMNCAVHTFSNSAAVWEPLVERVDLSVSGALSTHDYRIRLNRLEFVLSPHGVQIISRVVDDYNTTTLQKGLRKRFRLNAQNRAAAAEGGDGGAPMYVDEEEQLVSTRITAMDATYDEEELLTGSALSAGSIFDRLASTNRAGLPSGGASDGNGGSGGGGTYALVHVTNHCNATVMVNAQCVPPRGGSVQFGTAALATSVHWEQPIFPPDEPYMTSLSNPPLYAQARDFLIQSDVDIARDDAARRLRRVVRLQIFPLQITKTIVCLENKLSYAVSQGKNLPVIRAGERVYLEPKTDKNEPLVVQPVDPRGVVVYTAGVVGMNDRPPTLSSILCGGSVTLTSKASPKRVQTASSSSALSAVSVSPSISVLSIRVVVRQETMRGGVPTFVVSFEPLYLLVNHLPYRITVQALSDVNGDVVKGRSKAKEELFTTAVEPLESVELQLGALEVNQVALLFLVQQTGSAGASKAAESFQSYPTHAKTGLLSLRSSGREMTVRIDFANSRLRVSTPFTLLNHTSIPLSLRESNANGDVVQVDAERNYSVLHPGMNRSIAAAPKDMSKDTFFINLYCGGFSAKRLPLHVQQQGTILMEESAPIAKDMKRKPSLPPARDVMHLAYTSLVDESGSVLVTITPRWVIANRGRFPLYIAPSTFGGVSAQEAASAAAAAVLAAKEVSEQQQKTQSASSPSKAPMSGQQQDVDDFKALLQSVGGSDDTRLSDPSRAIALAPGSVTPLIRTPYCPPEMGYHLHILQSPLSPLFGTPISLETIHSELVVAYTDDETVRGEQSRAMKPPGGRPAARDRFYEVSLVSHQAYTYVIVEEPKTVPFLFLNRSRFDLVIRDTAKKSRGRLIAYAPAGHGTELVLDTTVTTMARIIPVDASRQPLSNDDASSAALFDFGRAMNPKELAASPCGLQYRVSYGQYGQNVVEIVDAAPSVTIARVTVACPPTPLELLVNTAVTTISVVTPSRDVVYAAITDIRLYWKRESKKETLQFSVKNFQVDNQTEQKPRYESCVLALRKSDEGAAISGFFERNIVPVKSLLWFEDARLDFAPVALRVSDTLLVTLAQFARAVRAPSLDEAQLTAPRAAATISPGLAVAKAQRCPTPQMLWKSTPQQADWMTTRVILERFIVNPIVIRFWLSRDVEENDFFRDQIHSRDAALLSMLVSSCQDVSISAPGIVSIKRSSRLGVLMQWLMTSYKDGVFAQLRGVLLQYASSLPLIGAPVKLVSGFGSGAVRLFREPIEGLSTSPKAFALGLANGSAGFAAGVTGGGLDAFANITDAGSRLLSLGRGMSERERRTQTTLSGFTSGLKGVVQRPMEGAAQSGTTGFMVGTAQGILGVLANPVAGLLSDVSRVSGTMAKLVTDTYIPQTRRLRPQRRFYANGGVAPWGAVLIVHQYERLSSGKWSGANLMSAVDGPEWDPIRKEFATFGPAKSEIPPGSWMLDRYAANFEGWMFSNKYNGVYTDVLNTESRTRRQRWSAMIKPLPYSAIATYLGVCPGMEKEPVSTTTSGGGSGGNSNAPAVPLHTPPGLLKALTVSEAQRATEAQHARMHTMVSLHKRGIDALSAEGVDEAVKSSHGVTERMQGWTAAGQHMGVKKDLAPPKRHADPERRSSINQPHDPAQQPRRDRSSSPRPVPRPTEGASSPPLPAPGPAVVTVDIVEYERRVALLGWSKRYLAANFPGWQDSHGREVPSKSSMAAPHGWTWATEWGTVGGGQDGWAIVPGDSNLRRRVWRRRMEKLGDTQR